MAISPVGVSTHEAATTCTTDVGRLVARIDGALGSTLLIGLDRLCVCRCSPFPAGHAPREPWSYADLRDVSIGEYKSLPVVLLELIHRPDPLPILVLERGQVEAALDGLVTLRRLVAAVARPGASAAPNYRSA